MRVPQEQVTTEEVKSWQGVHLLHFSQSACSQKVRILLREKGIDWTSHPVDLTRNEHASEWFLGINPRGVVPVLVHDGAVHIESNDLLAYLDELPSKAAPYFPQNAAERELVQRSLDLEDSLHMDLRAITMGVIVPSAAVGKSEEVLERYETLGAVDANRAKEVAWWRAFGEQGISQDQIRDAGANFGRAFDELDQRLSDRPWWIGERISVLEIAWFISLHRLVGAGYPMERHPRLKRHYDELLTRPAFGAEVRAPGAVGIALKVWSLAQRLRGRTLRKLLA